MVSLLSALLPAAATIGAASAGRGASDGAVPVDFAALLAIAPDGATAPLAIDVRQPLAAPGSDLQPFAFPPGEAAPIADALPPQPVQPGQPGQPGQPTLSTKALLMAQLSPLAVPASTLPKALRTVEPAPARTPTLATPAAPLAPSPAAAASPPPAGGRDVIALPTGPTAPKASAPDLPLQGALLSAAVSLVGTPSTAPVGNRAEHRTAAPPADDAEVDRRRQGGDASPGPATAPADVTAPAAVIDPAAVPTAHVTPPPLAAAPVTPVTPAVAPDARSVARPERTSARPLPGATPMMATPARAGNPITHGAVTIPPEPADDDAAPRSSAPFLPAAAGTPIAAEPQATAPAALVDRGEASPPTIDRAASGPRTASQAPTLPKLAPPDPAAGPVKVASAAIPAAPTAAPAPTDDGARRLEPAQRTTSEQPVAADLATPLPTPASPPGVGTLPSITPPVMTAKAAPPLPASPRRPLPTTEGAHERGNGEPSVAVPTMTPTRVDAAASFAHQPAWDAMARAVAPAAAHAATIAASSDASPAVMAPAGATPPLATAVILQLKPVTIETASPATAPIAAGATPPVEPPRAGSTPPLPPVAFVDRGASFPAPTPNTSTRELAPAPIEAMRTEPAFRAFAAAIFDAANAAAPVAAPAHAVPLADPSPLDLTQQRWPQAMVERIERLRDEASLGDTRIRLIPDALGTIDVALRRDGETVHVAFRAEQAETRQLLADARPELTALAEARGIRLADANASPLPAGSWAATASQPGQTFAGGDRAPRQQHQPSTPAAPRRAANAADEPGDDTRIA